MTKNHYDYQGKVVLVTGAGSGIGSAAAKAFLDNQATVVLVGRRLNKLEETVKGYPEKTYLLISEDLSAKDGPGKVIDAIESRFHRLDAVISNAGVFFPGSLEAFPEDQWEKTFAINLDANYRLAKAAFPLLKASKGAFVATSSVSGIGGDWGQAAYNASKFGLDGLIQCLALDWGKYGIRVNAVAPSLTETEMTAHVIQESDKDFALKEKPFLNRLGIQRIGKPEDIAPAFLFLASDDAKYITGVILPVDGGTSASNGQAHLQ